MSQNEQLRFFDEHYSGPMFKKRKPLPLPKIIKIEPADEEGQQEVESNVSTEDDDQLNTNWSYISNLSKMSRRF